MATSNENLLNPEERVLSTLEADGKRRWLHPRLSKGKHWQRRRLMAYGLIAFFTIVPWLRWNGQPLILLDIPNRKFLILGTTFLPTDTLPLALAILIIFLTIFFLTAVLGRVWCGWGCPQTVYMEFVFRPIERLLHGRKGVGGKPRKSIAPWRTVLKYVIFLVICAHLTNTFLAYFIGTDKLTQWIWTSAPWEHPGPFFLFVGITAFMMFDFAYWREQLCIIGCPYGRFQSVMLDRQSLIISYDPQRGEPRGKPRKAKRGQDVALPVVGDCVDCNQCVDVCPTGIDIRDGLQLECINCAQCIDACNDVMARFDRPLGLIRYGSQDAIDRKPTRILRLRVVLYPIAICLLLTGLLVFLLNKPTSDIEVLRTLGRPFSVTPEGLVDNTLRVKITNRTDETRDYRFAMPALAEAQVITGQDTLTLEPGDTLTQPIRVVLPFESFRGGRLQATLQITDDQDTAFDHKLTLQGPTAKPGTSTRPPTHENNDE
ncbi:cytochrome c oxidase accessory protein CcoG [Algisphaera agarilytica]|uniref:Cytochrome c oxidase accessory protein FixG n=1 Tax=Algisphaera agarilytica TaxID=1385975 RepID=A0A7X0LMY8_9BACT|nr:cytochrome c oxidase accessory protein CcoG [Algisphaera agarilytica]MBB6431508.1 cytochrome c oxidase accessory protein FixG [Algisphaera agarilytica]